MKSASVLTVVAAAAALLMAPAPGTAQMGSIVKKIQDRVDETKESIAGVEEIGCEVAGRCGSITRAEHFSPRAYRTLAVTVVDGTRRFASPGLQGLVQDAFESALVERGYLLAAATDADYTVGFEQIIANYGGTDAANLATYYSAVAEYKLGNPQQALAFIKNYDAPEGILGVGPLSFHAVILSDLGQFEEAAEAYITAADWEENEATSPLNYYQAAKALYNAGKYERAREIIAQTKKEYPSNSEMARLERLEGMVIMKQQS